MPKLERKIDISASQDKIWQIIDNDDDYPRWNIVVNEVSKLGEGNYFFKTNVGDITSQRVETNPPNDFYATQEGSPMTSLGYILKPKGDDVESHRNEKPDVQVFKEHHGKAHDLPLQKEGDQYCGKNDKNRR